MEEALGNEVVVWVPFYQPKYSAKSDTVKLGFTGVYIIFLISALKHRLCVLVRTASPRRFYQVPSIYVLIRNMKTTRNFHLKVFILGRKILNIFE